MASFFAGLFRNWVPSSSDHEGLAGSSSSSSSSSEVKGPSSSPPSPLARVFKLMDQNSDGLLSVQDMSQSFHKLGVELSPPLLNVLLSSFPLSHPGFLQFHEFEAFYASISKDLSGSPSCHLQASPCDTHDDTHSCHDGIHGANPCDVDGHGSSTSCDDDIYTASSCDDDLGSTKPCVDNVHHNHIPSPRLGASCVVHTHGDLDESSCHYDELSSGGSSDASTCHEANCDDDDLLEAFHVFDKNADGFISMPELQSVLCNLGFLQCQDDSFCLDILQRVDSNGDGLVDFTEFKHMMMSSNFV